MTTTVVPPHKSSLGMNANVAVLVIFIAMGVVMWIPILQYLAWAVPLVFFFLEKSSGFVKFYAIQALAVGILETVLTIIFAIIMGVLIASVYASGGASLGAISAVSVISIIVSVAITVLVVYLLIMAWGYKMVRLPIVGPMADKAAAKLDSLAAGFAANNQAGAVPPEQGWPAQPPQAGPVPPQQGWPQAGPVPPQQPPMPPQQPGWPQAGPVPPQPMPPQQPPMPPQQPGWPPAEPPQGQ